MTPDLGALRDASEARNAAAIVAAQAAEASITADADTSQLGIVRRALTSGDLRRAVTNWRQAQDRYNALADAVDLQAGVIR